MIPQPIQNFFNNAGAMALFVLGALMIIFGVIIAIKTISLIASSIGRNKQNQEVPWLMIIVGLLLAAALIGGGGVSIFTSLSDVTGTTINEMIR